MRTFSDSILNQLETFQSDFRFNNLLGRNCSSPILKKNSSTFFFSVSLHNRIFLILVIFLKAYFMCDLKNKYWLKLKGLLQ